MESLKPGPETPVLDLHLPKGGLRRPMMKSVSHDTPPEKRGALTGGPSRITHGMNPLVWTGSLGVKDLSLWLSK